jgi:hypothetical protein
MPQKGKVSKPMQVIALRLSEEDREQLQGIADAHGVTLSWLVRQGAKLYAQDLSNWLEERKRTEGEIGRRLAT